MPERLVDENHHQSFNYQGVKFIIHNPYEHFSKESAIVTTVANTSTIVYLNPKLTMIDEIIENYDSRRFV
jgi:hypothetical protein